jgi:hypothetical protein
VEDYESDSSVMIQLLQAIPKPILMAIIDNTLGHKSTTDPSIKRLALEADDCSGVYLNTIVDLKGKGNTPNRSNHSHFRRAFREREAASAQLNDLKWQDERIGLTA